MTLNDLLDLYVAGNLPRPASVRSYRSALSVFRKTLPPEIADDVRLITPTHVSRFKSIILESGRRPITWNTYRAQLKTLFSYAIQTQKISSCPFTPIKPARSGRRNPKTLKQVELEILLREIKKRHSHPAEAMFWKTLTKTLYYTGIRRQQAVMLRWADLNLEQAELLLRVETSKTGREYVIPISDAVLPDLIRLRKETANRKTISVRSLVFDPTLFCKRRSQPLTPVSLTSYYIRLGQQVGFPISPHRFRHTIATQLSNSGTNLKIVQEFLGHSDISTTALYVHPDIAAMRTALNSAPKLDT